MNIKLVWAASLLMASVISAGCGGSDPESSASRPAAPQATERSKDFGDYVLHYNALTTNQLPAAVASNFGIPRSKSRAMLNVVMMRKEVGTLGHSVTGTVTSRTTNLTGQLKNLELRPLTEGDATYYIGSIQVADGEVLVFDIEATPDGSTTPMTVKFQQQFFTR
ncbi:MAG: DUF4426 domain-containing protein [Gammaproteobacteria bacterium]|nr:DUF4426 domain-containing protein [Gammaproteobacteria bacterium]MDH3768615.1 DUF4426 domain-containing protein [Gammaproteobacteria bacterium]